MPRVPLQRVPLAYRPYTYTQRSAYRSLRHNDKGSAHFVGYVTGGNLQAVNRSTDHIFNSNPFRS